MSAPAAAPPEVLARPGEPECSEVDPRDRVRCARPPKHKGGHVDRQLKRYWQAEEAASVTP